MSEDAELLAEAEEYTRSMAERRRHHGALARFVAEYDRRGAEIERLQAAPRVSHRDLVRAVADPGAFVPRGDDYREPLPSWVARAVQSLLARPELPDGACSACEQPHPSDLPECPAPVADEELCTEWWDGYRCTEPEDHPGDHVARGLTGTVRRWPRRHVNVGVLDDGFGGQYLKCGHDDCGLEIVRPGKTQCWCDGEDPEVVELGPGESFAPEQAGFYTVRWTDRSDEEDSDA